MRHCKSIAIFLSVLCILLFASCKNIADELLTPDNHIILNDSLYWAPCKADSTPEDVAAYNGANYHFQRMNDFGSRNLYNLVSDHGQYVWLKIVFEIPEELKHKDLGLYIDYIHFADKVWINGYSSGEYGQFPPNAKSSMYIGHYYDFPESMLNQKGNNTILIKVYCLGNAAINGNIIVTEKNAARISAGRTTMANSSVYMIFSGALILVFLLYLIMFIHNRKMKEYFSFALLNLATFLLTSVYYIPQIPIVTHPKFSFFLYIKIALGIGFILLIYVFTSFVLNFLRVKISKTKQIIRVVYLHCLALFVLFVPDYVTLVRLSIPLIVASSVQLFYCLLDFTVALKTSAGRRHIKIMFLSLIPLGIALCIDIVNIGILHGSRNNFITYYGWLFYILSNFTILAIRYNKVSNNFEKLNKDLENEILTKTENLKVANDELQYELRRSRADMRMAAIVQQKFFPYPNRTFIGWDLAVCYNPVAEVSGDLFDLYSMGSILDGMALFDVSGHGIAAGLITMLSKNIIFQSFTRSRFENRSMDSILTEVNEKITEAKGDVDNYLTGVLCRFLPFNDEDDSCELEMSNAGHPYPLLYKADENKIVELKGEDGKTHFGAIGLMGSNVSFVNTNVLLKEDDILVFYTDGITECENDSGEAFGIERLKQLVLENNKADAKSIVNIVTSKIAEFMEHHERTDDLTLIVMKRQGSNEYLQEL